MGNTLVLRPLVQAIIGDLTPILSLFSPDFMAAGREFHEQSERDWSGNGPQRIDASPASAVDKAPG